MSTSFNAQQGLIVVRALLWGPKGQRSVRLALDTGASSTVVNTAILVTLGYDPALSPDRVQMTTRSGVEYVPRLSIDRIKVLEQERTSFLLIAHTLPPSASVDGLLGLDFFRGHELRIDFLNGQITLRA